METVIDLDLFDRPDVDEGPGGHGHAWSEFRAVAFVAVLLLAMLLGGAALPAGPKFPYLRIKVGDTVTEAGGFDLVGGVLYVRSRDGDAITAYSPDDGARLWRTPARVTKLTGNLVAAGDVLLVGEDDRSGEAGRSGRSAGGSGTTVALDVRTGQRLWRSDGRPFAADAAADFAAIVSEQPDVNRSTLLQPPSTVTGVQLSTGRMRWSYDIGMQTGVSAALVVRVDSPLLVTAVAAVLFDPERGDRLIDFSTGEVRGAGDLPLSLVGNFTVRFDELLITVVPQDPTIASPTGGARVRGPFGERWIVQAYQQPSLHPVWRTVLDAGLFVFKPCGSLVCASTGGRVQALDPASGQVRWQAPWSYAGGSADRVVAVGGANGGIPKVGVLDGATGRTLAVVGRWQPAGPVEAPWVPLVRPGAGGSARNEVAVLDRDRLSAYGMGSFTGPASRCHADERYLACPTEEGHLAVWRYRPARA